MMVHVPNNNDNEPWRPTLFSSEEWGSIVSHLKLSPRQAQIVGFLLQSVSRESIRRLLGITGAALRTHYDRARARLKAEDQMQIAMRVFKAFRDLYG